MRFWLLILLLMAPRAGWAEPGTMCSPGRFGHIQCMRPSHFAFDLCQTLEKQARRHGLDPGFFTRLIWQESRFDPNAVSPARAMGIAQFIASTAALRGLKDPFNPGDALESSAEYLGFLQTTFGNPGLAAVAYNSGESRAARFMAGQSGLPRETVNYVQIITGLSAERWRDDPPSGHDFGLEDARAFMPACLSLAQGRRITPLGPVPARIKPWGVQIAFGTTRSRAHASVKRNTRACRRIVAGESIDYIRVKHRAQGRKGYLMARIGRNSRSNAVKLCRRLLRSGCKCRVFRNP